MLVKAESSYMRTHNGKTYTFQHGHVYNIPKDLGKELLKANLCELAGNKELTGSYTDYELNPPRYDIENKEEKYLVLFTMNVKDELTNIFSTYNMGDVITLKNYRAEQFMKSGFIIPLNDALELIAIINNKVISERQRKIETLKNQKS